MKTKQSWSGKDATWKGLKTANTNPGPENQDRVERNTMNNSPKYLTAAMIALSIVAAGCAGGSLSTRKKAPA